MPILSVNANETNKDTTTQLTQIQQAFQDTQNWSQSIQAAQLIDYSEPTNAGDESTSSASYVAFKNFSFNTTVINPLCLLNFHLTIKGYGNIGIFVNNLLIKTIPFQNTGFNGVSYSHQFNLVKGSNRISLQWFSSSGTSTKANSQVNPGTNELQLTSQNS